MSYRLVEHQGSPALRVTADGDWLDQPGRAFPVRLDPPVLAQGAATESLVVQGGSSHSGGELAVGRRNGANSASYLRFPGLVSTLANETIFSAQLSFAAYDAPSCKPRPLSVHPVTGSWSTSTDTAYPGPSVGAALATTRFAQGYVGLGQSSSACPVTGTVMDLGAKGRDLVQGWVSGKPNHGLSLRAPVADESSWKTIAGTGTANPPKLYVTHTPYNAKYAVPDPTPKPAVLQNQAGKVKVAVTNKSAMAWTTSGFRLIYRVYNAKTNAKVGQYVAASLPSTVARNATVTLDATIKALPVGEYLLDFSMATADGKVVFTDELVPPARIALRVENIAPVVGSLFPPNGYQSPTLTPQLWAQAVDLDAPPKQTLQYRFEYCATTTAGDPTGCTTTAYQAGQAFTIPAAKLKWSTTYLWRAFVKDNTTEISTDYATLVTAVPQPEITSRVANAPYGSAERDFDPDIGNFSTGAVDITVPSAGPPLAVTRTYNSLDPRRDLSFGAGWMSQLDMRVTADADGSGNVLVTYPDGQQVRFGRNADGTFAAPSGRTAQLTIANGAYVLRDLANTTYRFRGGDGRIASITDKYFRMLEFAYDQNSGRLRKIHAHANTNVTTGRALNVTWNTAGTHIAAVTTDPVDGRTLTWAYEYDGDLLTKVCGPGGQACTTYAYTPGSHYRSAVLDSGPDSYWRLAEKTGATAAGSEIANNLGKDAGVLRNVTFEQPGALTGSEDTSAAFNGASSAVELPKGLVKRSRETAVELWFKVTATQTGGPLLGYQDTALDGSPTAAVPLLYVGTDGRVRGQFKTTSGTPKPIDTGVDVRDGKWHHVVLSVTGDVQSLYLDGVKKGTKPASDGVLDHSTLTFNQAGAAWAANPATWPAWGTAAKRFFHGSLDEVAVYGKALSDQSVLAHYRLGAAQADQLSQVTLPSGKVAAEAVYDTAADRLTEYTDGNGGTWKIGSPTVYGGDTDLRRAVQVLDPADRAYLYEYDALADRLLRSGSPLGITARLEDQPMPSPTPSPSPTRVCNTPDPGDPQFCTDIPPGEGGPVFVENALSGMVVRSFGYDARGRQNQIANENGDVLTLTFDDRGNITSRKNCRKAGDCQTSYTSYTTPSATNPFDPRNDLPVEIRDPRSSSATDVTYRNTQAYNNAGDVVTETGPDGAFTQTAYTSGSELPYGSTTGFVPAGLISSVTDAAGRVTRYRYTESGDLALVTTPTGLVTETTYDALGRKIREKETSDSFPDGVVTTFTYDDFGRLTTTTGPVTTNAVDGTKHQAITGQAYDLDGNVVRTVIKDLLDAGEPERVTTVEYDEFNRPTRTVNPEGDEQTESWDRFGNRVGVVDGNGNRYGYAYTALNKLAEVRLYDLKDDPAYDPDLGYVVLTSYAYDFGGRMAAQVDSMGRRLEYTYLGDDLLSKVVLKNFHNPDGSTRDYVVEEYTYDAAGNVTRRATDNGSQVTTHVIDRLNRISRTTFDPDGLARSTAFEYDVLGNVTKTTQSGNASNAPWLTAPASNVLVNTYNARGQLEQEREVDGTAARTKSYTYDQRGNVLTSTDPRGNVSGADKAAFTTTYRYDENGDRTASIAPAVSTESGGAAAQTTTPTVTTGYNAFGEAVATRDALGVVVRTKFDRMGRVVATEGTQYIAPGGPNISGTPVSRATYDALGNVVESTDAKGHVTRYTYDRLNRMLTRDQAGATDSQRLVWKYTYTRTGKVLSTTSPTGIRTEATYDDLDRQITATVFERKPVARTLTSRNTYDDAGNVIRVTSPTGLVTTMSYNGAGELISTTDPAKVTNFVGYDGFGKVIRQTDGAGRTTRRDFNVYGDLVAEIDLSPAGDELRREKYTHDANGNVVTRTNGLDRTVTFTYDPLDRLVRQVEPKTATATITTSFGYDAAGHRTRYTDGRGHATHFTYNSLGLPESVIEPATTAHPAPADRTWTAAYDLNGNNTLTIAPGGVTRNREYDAANRLIAETGAGAEAGTVSRGLTYDDEGRLTGAAGGGQALTFTYNDRGGLLGATGIAGDSSFDYDDDGRVTRRTDAAGTSTFEYLNGRLRTTDSTPSGVTQKFGYNTAGMISSIDYGSGRIRSYGYDDLGRLTSDVLKNNTGAEAAKVVYRYDLDDHIIGKDTAGTAGAGTNTYAYDHAGRLTSWTSASGTVDYAWDDSGNRTRAGDKTATYDERNRILSDGDYTYTYTARGTRATRTSSGLTEKFNFDAFDRLISSAEEFYVYDPLNRVTSRNEQKFRYAGAEQDPVDDGTERYGRGPSGELISVEDSTAGTRITISDQHDDVIGSFGTGSTLGTLDGSTAYDPYGKRIATTGEQANVGFQGDWTDPDTGQIDMGARWYDPNTGGFTSRDTVQYSQGDSVLANKYTYGAGDPLGNNDPTGNWPSCGWCKKVSNAVSSAWNATTSFASTAWNYTTSYARTAWNYVSSAGSWLWNQAKAAKSWIVNQARPILNSIKNTWNRGTAALRSGYDRYVAPKLRQARDYAAQKMAEAKAAAVRVTTQAKAAISHAVEKVSIKRIGVAVLAQLKSIKVVVSSAMPAVNVQSFSSVVQDLNTAAQVLYKTATAVGGAVISGANAVGEWVSDHKAEIIGGIAGAVVGIGCGALIGVTGVGAVACAAAGGAVGSLVTDLVAGGKGWKEMAANAVLGGAIGAVMGPLSSVAGSAVSGAVRGLIGGGVRSAFTAGSSAAASTLRSFGSTQLGGAAGRYLSNRAASTASREAVETTGAGVRSSARAQADSGGGCRTAAARGGNSFAVGTAVLMADGSTKPIEDVRVGDLVLATDPTTGKTEAKPVTALIVGIGQKPMVTLTVDVDGDAGDKTATIDATEGHPFWSADLGEWADAGDLKPGALLRTGAGTFVQVEAVHRWTAQDNKVHNLTVDGIHTFYALADTTPVLVHNCISPEPGPAPEGSTLEDYRQANLGPGAPRFVTEFTSLNGNRYYGRTTSGGVDIEPGSVLADSVRNRAKKGCSEICAANEAQEAGDEIYGGTFRTLKTNSGEEIAPCPDECQTWIQHRLGCRWPK